MKHLVEVPLEDGSSMIVEVDDPGAETIPPRTVRGLRDQLPQEIIEKVDQTFEAALDKVKPAAAAIIAKLRDLKQAPDQIGVEFGIKLGAKAVAFIASADTEANFKITLTWHRDNQQGGEK